MFEYLPLINEMRVGQGFLSVEETVLLSQQSITIMDPFSTLVSRRAQLSEGILIWPNVTISVGPGGSLTIGSQTVLHSGVRVDADKGSIEIGCRAELGQLGGFTILAPGDADLITIGDEVRLNGGGSVAFKAVIGNGAQVLGPINVQHCKLGGGGSHREPDPDKRGGVLKGCGVARHLEIAAGMVIQAFGDFGQAPLRPQTFFHPKL
jgi:carbonic anhydrase/acetyltransferase-like protein (isoleucine patch superfamily)